LNESESSSDWEEDLDELLHLGKEEGAIKLPMSAQAKLDSNKGIQLDQDSTSTLVIHSTPEGRTVRWEKKGLHNRSAEISDLQTDELPFQEGAPLDLPKAEDKQDIEDLSRNPHGAHIRNPKIR